MRSLGRYLLIRTLLTIPMIFVLVTLVFLILRVMPGDPVKAAIRPGAPQEYIDEIRHTLGLDKPLYVQYGEYLWDLLHLDLGTTLSPVRGQSVAKQIWDHFPATLELSLAGLAAGGRPHQQSQHGSTAHHRPVCAGQPAHAQLGRAQG